MESENLDESNADSKHKIPESRALLERWAAVCDSLGGEPAVFGVTGRTTHTFADLDREANAVAARLAHGLPRGSVVGLCGENSGPWIASLLGIWKAGCVALLEDTKMSAAARDVAERETHAFARLVPDPLASEPALVPLIIRNPVPDFGRVDCLIKLTSGTTGCPRALRFTPSALVADCLNVCSTMGISRADRNFGVIAFSHSYGFSNLVTPLVCLGIPLVASRDALPRAILDGIRATDASVLPAVPALFDAMAGVAADVPTLRVCISAGAPLRTATAQAFFDRFGRKLHSFYGASECGGICYDRSEEPVGGDAFVGTPMDGVTLDVRETGEPGRVEITVHGDALALDCAEGFQPTDILSGNRVEGFRIVGRASEWINVAGRKIDPAEIESALRSATGLWEVVVFGVDCEKRGQQICALVAGDETAGDAVRALIDARLSPAQRPREIRVVSEIPTNARGKISRRDLAARWLEGRLCPDETSGPQSIR